MERIEIEFEQAKNQGQKVLEVSEELKGILNNEFLNLMEILSKCWRSNHTEDYIKKCQTVYDDMEKEVIKLEKTASQMTLLAQNLYKVESESVILAQN